MAKNVGSILLDGYSLKILSELQRDSRQTVQQLSAAVGLSPTPCWKRVKDMTLRNAGEPSGFGKMAAHR